MPALLPGTPAPSIDLPTLDGNRFSLAEARKKGPVLAAFFKAACPTCQMALPYLERIYKAYPAGKFTMMGISQDEEDTAADFARTFGVTFPIALEDTSDYRFSNAYGLTNVPSIFLVSPQGQVEASSVGWLRSEIEDLNVAVARASGAEVKPLFHPGEDVPEFKAG